MGSERAAPADRRSLHAIDIACIVVGGIIGVGIFFTPAKVAVRTGSDGGLLLAWGIGAVLALLGALTFCDLTERMPKHGGTFVFLRRAFGPATAFLFGWTNLLVIQSGAMAVVALILVDHLEKGLGFELGTPVATSLAAGWILAFAWLNYLGLSVGKTVQNLLTALKLVAVFGLAGAALLFGPAGEPSAAQAATPVVDQGLGGVLWAMLPVVFSFGGWQQGSFVAGSARNPARDAPLGILLGVIVVAAAYLSINLGLLRLLGLERMAGSTTVAADGMAAMVGEEGGRVMALVVVVSAAGILNTICLAPPYVLHAMAQESLVPERIGRMHPRFGGPSLAVLLQGGWSVLLLFVAHVQTDANTTALDNLMDGVVFADWLFYVLAGLALLVLRRRLAAGSFQASWPVPLLFALAGSAIAVVAVVQNPWPSAVGVGFLGFGYGVHRWLRRGDPSFTSSAL